MAKNNDEFKFRFTDRIWWWGSNILALVSSIVLVLAVIVSLPFRRYRSVVLRYVVRLITLCLVIAVIVGCYLYYFSSPSLEFGNQTKYLLVHRGDTVYDIGYKLRNMGAISSEFNFLLFSKVLRYSRKLKAGRYAIEPDASLADIFGALTSGAAVPFNVTVPEGLTVKQTAESISRELDLGKDDLIAVCNDKTLIDSLGIPTDNLEGYLFPDTYNFFFDETPRSVVDKMLAQFNANLPDSFEQKAKDLGLSFYEAVTMASLIEKEAMLDSERPIISAVYHNRLKIRMRLQCDPTVIYALGGLDRPLYRRDLQINSPYNTYKYYGLPPGPICSPGRASLDAAVNPADVSYLYFVAKGDGSHVFTNSNREHINAKNKIKRDQKLGLFQ